MNDPNEISVEMRLKLDKLRQDAKNAGRTIQSGLATGTPDMKAQERADQRKADDQSRRERVDRARRNAAMDLADEVRDASRRNQARRLLRQREEERSGRPIQGPDLSGSLRSAAAKARMSDRARFDQNIAFGTLPIFNPTSLVGNFFAGRQSFKAFSGTQTGAKLMGSAGLSGAGGAAAAALAVTGAAIAVGLSLMALKKAVEGMKSAIEQASRTYSKILSSGGMAPGFVVRREQLSNVLGVSEEQVMQYGAAIEYLNDRLDASTKILTETNPTLAATSMRFRVMGEDMKALFAQMASDLAPAINKVADGVHNFLGMLERHPAIMKIITAVAVPASIGVGGADKAPGVPTSIRQLPMAAMEKAGLVIGRNQGAADHQRQIAENTKKTVDVLHQIANHFGGGVPRSGGFAPNPTYAQP